MSTARLRFLGTAGLLSALIGMLSSQLMARPSEEEARAALAGFFNALSVENYPRDAMDRWITDDFVIFEMGQAFSWPQFQTFLSGAGYANWLSTDWQFSDIKISLDERSAHLSYVNTGQFIYPDPGDASMTTREENVWLESVYLVQQDGGVKIRFLQSDNISREITQLP